MRALPALFPRPARDRDAMGAEPVFAFNPAPPNPKCPVSARMADVLAPVMAAAQEAVRERLRKITLASLLRQI